MRWFVSLKAYCDFIIACNFLRVEEEVTNVLLCGGISGNPMQSLKVRN